MGRLWTRDDWNDIIRRVNSLIDNCGASDDPLDEVGPNHIWTPDDIRAVRDKLASLCSNEPVFAAELKKWKQDIIDEIEEALENCECCDWSGIYSLALSTDLTVTESEDQCSPNGLCGVTCAHWISYNHYFNIRGLQLGPPGIRNRWYLMVKPSGAVYNPPATLLPEDGKISPYTPNIFDHGCGGQVISSPDTAEPYIGRYTCNYEFQPSSACLTHNTMTIYVGSAQEIADLVLENSLGTDYYRSYYLTWPVGKPKPQCV